LLLSAVSVKCIAAEVFTAMTQMLIPTVRPAARKRMTALWRSLYGENRSPMRRLS